MGGFLVLFDPLLRSPALVVEADARAVRPRECHRLPTVMAGGLVAVST